VTANADPNRPALDVPGPCDLTTVAGRTIPDLLIGHAEREPDRIMLVADDGDALALKYTASDVLNRSLGFARWLSDHGLRSGDRVQMLVGNRPEFLFAWFGAAMLGVSIVPTNLGASPDEVAYIAGHAHAGMTITDLTSTELATLARQQLGHGRVICIDIDEIPDGTDVAVHKPAPLDEMAIMYTSGTTSRPKGVKVTHANYLYAGEVVAKALRLGPHDRVLTVLPLFHANAQYYTTMGSLVSGASMTLAPKFSASRFLSQCARHHITVASLFAAPIRMVLARNQPEPDRALALRCVIFAQNLSARELAAWDATVGAPLIQLYGMTETMGPPLINPLDDNRPSSIGRVSLGYRCRVVDESGRDVSAGESGRLQVEGIPGVTITSGYLNDPEATGRTIVDGWLDTGDVVRVEADGFFYFVDREKDMIKRSGENVAAGEVEAVLAQHAAVRDVAVVGVPDAVRDEQIIAFVVTAENIRVTEPELVDWCQARLARFRVPQEIRFIDVLPRTSVGKVRKPDLRALWLESQPSLSES
jgi:crotonobetaine/carnitine-CoA ligase